MPEIDSRFAARLAPFTLDELEEHVGVIYGIWRDGRLAYFNPAWSAFAKANGAAEDFFRRWTIGADTTEVCPPALAPFYADMFARCWSEDAPQVHVYECSSPRVFRRFHMIAYPIGRTEGLLVVNSKVVERPAPREPAHARRPDRARYLDRHGLLHQCCHCRRFEQYGAGRGWDWVPVWIDPVPANTSHGLCPVCFDYHYRARPVPEAS